jgi:hypothetical protein
MPRRLLNIASIVCLVLCVTLMGMWVRSYYYLDYLEVHLSDTAGVALATVPGKLQLMEHIPRVSSNWHWMLSSEPFDARPRPIDRSFWKSLGFRAGVLSSRVWVVQLPYWFLILASGTLAAILWYKERWQFTLLRLFVAWLRNLFIDWRFSLRSFFIVTMFLGFVLGMIVCVDRWWIGK